MPDLLGDFGLADADLTFELSQKGDDRCGQRQNSAPRR